VLATYGDKLLEATSTGRVRAETAELAEILFRLAGAWARAHSRPCAGRRVPEPLPEWHTAIRKEQLVGMRETLEALRIYLAHELRRFEGRDSSSVGLREPWRRSTPSSRRSTVSGSHAHRQSSAAASGSPSEGRRDRALGSKREGPR